MSDSNDDFLTARLGNILKVENHQIDFKEEAIPWKCWGRGGDRPVLSQLNFQRLLEVSGRCKISSGEPEVKPSPNTLPVFPVMNENIMGNITSECHEILGDPKTDKNIAEWLRQSFAEAEKQNNTKQHESLQESLSKDYNFKSIDKMHLASNVIDQGMASSMGDRTGIDNNILCQSNKINNIGEKEKNATSQLFLSKQNISDHEYSGFLFQLPSNKLSSVAEQMAKKSSSGLNIFDREGIVCIPNRSNSFTIENLPTNITRIELMQVLSSFGTVENILIRESDGNVTATIRMGSDCNCAWIIDCLNGTQPFGGSNV